MGLVCYRSRGQGPLGNRMVAVSMDGKTHTIRCIFEAPSPKELVDGNLLPQSKCLWKGMDPRFLPRVWLSCVQQRREDRFRILMFLCVFLGVGARNGIKGVLSTESEK